MTAKARHIIENNFSAIMLLTILLGLYVPGLENTSPLWITISLSVIIFLSSFQIAAENLRDTDYLRCSFVYVARFLLLPALLFYLCSHVSDVLATSVLLFALMPTGVSAPAISGLFDGNVGLALGLVLLSSMLSPLLIPTAFFLFQGSSVQYDYSGMVVSLASVVILPVLLHIPLRRNVKLAGGLKLYSKSVSTLLVAFIILLVIAGGRSAMLADLQGIVFTLLLASGLFVVFYSSAWLLSSGLEKEERIAMTISSGVNNNALGIGIASLHFEPAVALFFLISEIPWVAGIAVFGSIAKRSRTRNSGER